MNKNLSQILNKPKENEQVISSKIGGKCEIYGCPLTASMASNHTSPAYCKFHYGVKYENCHKITLILNQNMDLNLAIDKCLHWDKFYSTENQAEHEIELFLIKKNLKNLYVKNNLYRTGFAVGSHLFNLIRQDNTNGTNISY